MRLTILALVLVAAASLAFAGTTPHFATVTYTLESGQTWSDSGNLTGMHALPSSTPGYTIFVFDFDDHSDVFHLDGGGIGLTLR